MAGEIVGTGHVGVGEIGYHGEELLAFCGFGYVTAVEENIAFVS